MKQRHTIEVTPFLASKIAQAIAQGLSIHAAKQQYNISYRTIQKICDRQLKKIAVRVRRHG